MPSDEVPCSMEVGWYVVVAVGEGEISVVGDSFFCFCFLSEPTIDPKMYDVFFLIQRYETYLVVSIAAIATCCVVSLSNQGFVSPDLTTNHA